MKFKLDENLGDIGCDLLAAEGSDVMTVAQQNLSGASDQHVFAICQLERRILVTLDHDFGNILQFSPQGSAGIVILECKGRAAPNAIRARICEMVVVSGQVRIRG